MEREAVMKQMKALKAKYKAAKKDKKRDLAMTFRAGAKRLQRELKATKPPPAKKEEAASA